MGQQRVPFSILCTAHIGHYGATRAHQLTWAVSPVAYSSQLAQPEMYPEAGFRETVSFTASVYPKVASASVHRTKVSMLEFLLPG